MSKVLLFNCSPHKSGNTFLALSEVAKELCEEGIDTEIVHIGTKAVHGCIACYSCKKEGAAGCVFSDDVVNGFSRTADGSDGFVIGSPVYYGLPAGQCMAMVQRMLCSAGNFFSFKPVANVAVCRRGGATAALEAMNMPWMMVNCPIVSSTYWNIVYGHQQGEAVQDAEGMQVMRTLARNMAWMMRCTEHNDRPRLEPRQQTNLIR